MRFNTVTFLLLSTTLFAGNGTHFTGISPVSKSMGGAGTAYPTGGSDAAFKNPSMISELNLKKGELLAEAAFFANKSNATANNTGLGEKDSTASANFSPALSATYQMTDPLTLGLYVFTYGGAKSDFTGEATLQEVKTESTMTAFGPNVSYKILKNWSLGISPHLVYADLALNKSNAALKTPQTNRPAHGTIGYGIHLGTAISPLKDLLLGLSFRPKIRIRYKEVADLDSLNLLAGGTGDGILDDVDSEDPAQVGFGASYAVLPQLKVTLEGRFIGWSNADVFRELGWQDQYALGLGAEYRIDKIAIRAGFNYAKSVVEEASGEAGLTPVVLSGHTVSRQSLSNLTLTGFSGIVTSHVCVGAGYDFTEKLTGDFSAVYVPSNTVTRSGTGIAPTATPGAYSYTGKVSQWSIGLGGTYKF